MKISLKLLFSYLLLGILANLAIFFYLETVLKNFLINKAELNLRKDLLLVKDYISLSDPYLASNRSAQEIVDKLSLQIGARITLINKQGVVLGDSEVRGEDVNNLSHLREMVEIKQAFKEGYGKLIRQTSEETLPVIYLAIPVAEGRGAVRLVRPLYEVSEADSLAYKTLVFGLPIALLISLILSYSVGGTVARNLRRMAKIAAQIAHNDYSGKFRYWGNDELGDLTKSLNSLTEQLHQTMENLIKDKIQIRAILDSMSEGVLVLRRSSRITLINPGLLNILKLQESDVIGRYLAEVIRNYELQEVFQIAVERNEAVTNEIDLGSSGLNVTLVVHIQPIEGKSSQGGFVAIFYDVSTIKKLETIRRDFVANASHELKTPVATIRGYAETLLEGALEDVSVARKFIETIHKNSQRLGRLIDDLLELSRIESQKKEYKLELVELEEILSHALRNIDATVQQKNLNISIEIPNDFPCIKADRLDLEHILFNLLDNAARYNKESGSLSIRAYIDGGMVQIAVSDTGIGIPEEHIPRIFERFYRVDPSRSRELGGTGLGLSIVKHLVSALSGTINVQSKPGQGSTFTLTLPLV